MTMTKMATLMYMMKMMIMTMVMTVTLIISMAARRTVMIMMELRVAVMGTKATIAEKLYVKVDPNNKIKLRFMLESSRALML